MPPDNAERNDANVMLSKVSVKGAFFYTQKMRLLEKQKAGPWIIHAPACANIKHYNDANYWKDKKMMLRVLQQSSPLRRYRYLHNYQQPDHFPI